MTNIQIREGSIQDAATVLSAVSEFGGQFPSHAIERELADKRSLVIVAYEDVHPAGCVVSFDKYHDGSLYCWLVGVDPRYRGRGIMAALMAYQDDWARLHQYHSLRIKTRNDRREMLTYLIRAGYHVVGVYVPEIPPQSLVRRIIDRVLRIMIEQLSRLHSSRSPGTRRSSEENRIVLEKTY